MKPGAKLFSVLETLCIDGEAGVTDLSKKLELCKSSIHRFLSEHVDNSRWEKKRQKEEEVYAFWGVNTQNRVVLWESGAGITVWTFFSEVA